MKDKEHNPNFSLNDFKKWMSQQKYEYVRKPKYKGCFAESKLSLKRLVGKVEVENGNLLELAKDFCKNGGTVIDCDGDNVLTVEVTSGTLRVPKFFVKLISNSYDES